MLKVTIGELCALAGHKIGPSEWVTVDQGMIDRFGALTGDMEWIHVDQARAIAAFGGTIAHGLLSLSLSPGLAQTILEISDGETVLNYGYDKMRFLSVVHADDRVRLVITPKACTPRGDGQLLRLEHRIEVYGKDQPALVADWLLLFFPGVAAMAKRASLPASIG